MATKDGVALEGRVTMNDQLGSVGVLVYSFHRWVQLRHADHSYRLTPKEARRIAAALLAAAEDVEARQ